MKVSQHFCPYSVGIKQWLYKPFLFFWISQIATWYKVSKTVHSVNHALHTIHLRIHTIVTVHLANIVLCAFRAKRKRLLKKFSSSFLKLFAICFNCITLLTTVDNKFPQVVDFKQKYVTTLPKNISFWICWCSTDCNWGKCRLCYFHFMSEMLLLNYALVAWCRGWWQVHERFWAFPPQIIGSWPENLVSFWPHDLAGLEPVNLWHKLLKVRALKRHKKKRFQTIPWLLFQGCGTFAHSHT